MARSPYTPGDPTIAVAVSGPFARIVSQADEETQARVRTETRRLLHQYGIAPESLLEEFARVPHRLALDSLQMAIDALDDPALGLHAGDQWQFGDHELLDYLCATCSTLGEAIETMTQHITLVSDVASMWLTTEDDRAVVHYTVDPNVTSHLGQIEYTITVLLRWSQYCLGRPGGTPLEIRFAHSRPFYGDEYEAIFGCPVRFECPTNALVMPAAGLQIPLPTADPVLHRLLRRQAADHVRALQTWPPFVQQVRDTIEHELADTGAPLRSIARQFGMSPATLRRRLGAENTSFSDLVEDVRRQLALRLLADSTLGLDEISTRLGFAQTPAFHRAFKRWFGQTPAEYRNRRVRRPFWRFIEERPPEGIGNPTEGMSAVFAPEDNKPAQ